jgi:hypothetical protein
VIGTTGADIVISVKILLVCVLAIGSGGLTCFALRRSWNIKQGLIDAGLAAVITVVAALVISATDPDIWRPHSGLILAIPLGTVVARHFIRLAVHAVYG